MLQSVANAPCPVAGLSDLLLPSRHPTVNIIPPAFRPDQSDPRLQAFRFHKSLKSQMDNVAPPPHTTPSCTRSSSIHLLTGCHVQQPSPRQCLAFLSPLTAARVKPLGFAPTGIQLEGGKAGPADMICLLHSLTLFLLHELTCGLQRSHRTAHHLQDVAVGQRAGADDQIKEI